MSARDDLVKILLATAQNSPEWTADAIIGSGWRPSPVSEYEELLRINEQIHALNRTLVARSVDSEMEVKRAHQENRELSEANRQLTFALSEMTDDRNEYLAFWQEHRQTLRKYQGTLTFTADHEHEWVDVRDLIAPPGFCAICKEWQE